LKRLHLPDGISGIGDTLPKALLAPAYGSAEIVRACLYVYALPERRAKAFGLLIRGDLWHMTIVPLCGRAVFCEGISRTGQCQCQFVLFDGPTGRTINSGEGRVEIIGQCFKAEAVDRSLACERA
jgi:hypothetical protein